MKSLIIYIAEDDHGDMSYGSLTEEIIKYCTLNELRTKIFSEFPSQTLKSQKQKVRNGLESTNYKVTDDVMTLEKDCEIVKKTAEFLDKEFIEMGVMEERYKRYNETFKEFNPTLTITALIEQRKEFIDNSELLELMRLDAKTGEISGKEKIGNLENFYAYWRSPMHYKMTHERMVEDIKTELEKDISNKENSNVIIISVGSPHIPGLDKQLTSLQEPITHFKDSKKIIVGKFPKNLTGLDKYVFEGTPKECKKVGDLVEFAVNTKERKAIIPDSIKNAILDHRQNNLNKPSSHLIKSSSMDKVNEDESRKL